MCEVTIDDKKMMYTAIYDIISDCNNRKKMKIEFAEVAFDIPSSFKIMEKASNALKEDPAVLQIDTKSNELDFVIVGDIHGSLESIVQIFKEKGYPPNTRYLFLGDYVDRGTRSCEVLILLYSLKYLFPNDIFLLRGNHEFKKVCGSYGFKQECNRRIKDVCVDDFCYTSDSFYQIALETFSMLPICAILDDSIFCVHGGITSLINNRQELFGLNKIGDRFGPENKAQAEMLWNDPSKYTYTYNASSRGKGSVFGRKAVEAFLKNMNFKLIIRGHQNVVQGYDWPFGKKGGILTVFSAVDYCKTSNNGGIAIVIKENNISDWELVNTYQIDRYSKYDSNNHCFSFPLDNYIEN